MLCGQVATAARLPRSVASYLLSILSWYHFESLWAKQQKFGSGDLATRPPSFGGTETGVYERRSRGRESQTMVGRGWFGEIQILVLSFVKRIDQCYSRRLLFIRLEGPVNVIPISYCRLQ